MTRAGDRGEFALVHHYLLPEGGGRERESERKEQTTMGLKGCLQEWLLTLKMKKRCKMLNLSL